jgi:hypothetical protein
MSAIRTNGGDIYVRGDAGVRVTPVSEAPSVSEVTPVSPPSAAEAPPAPPPVDYARLGEIVPAPDPQREQARALWVALLPHLPATFAGTIGLEFAQSSAGQSVLIVAAPTRRGRAPWMTARSIQRLRRRSSASRRRCAWCGLWRWRSNELHKGSARIIAVLSFMWAIYAGNALVAGPGMGSGPIPVSL